MKPISIKNQIKAKKEYFSVLCLPPYTCCMTNSMGLGKDQLKDRMC